MKIRYISTEPNWVRSLDFETLDFLPEGSGVECRVFAINDLNWTVFNFLAPRDTGFWFLRVYPAFEASLRKVFFTRDARGNRDDERRKRFEQKLRRLQVPIHSNCAYWTFGIYPRLWGKRFEPCNVQALSVHRLLSVCVPSDFAFETRAYFDRQAAEFGANCIANARPEDCLFVTSEVESNFDANLLLKSVLKMSPPERRQSIDRIQSLLASEVDLSNFAVKVPVGIKFSGAVREPPSETDLEAVGIEHNDICQRFLRLRIGLVCRLGWPHMIEYAKTGVESCDYLSDMRAPLREVLARVPVVSEDPLGACAHGDGGTARGQCR
jgi:hypothetical protein